MLAIPIICIKVMIFLVSGHISWLLLFHISAVPKGEERTLDAQLRPDSWTWHWLSVWTLACRYAACLSASFSRLWNDTFLLYGVSAFIGTGWVLQILYKGKGSDLYPVVLDAVQVSVRLCPCLAGLAGECDGNLPKVCKEEGKIWFLCTMGSETKLKHQEALW